MLDIIFQDVAEFRRQHITDETSEFSLGGGHVDDIGLFYDGDLAPRAEIGEDGIFHIGTEHTEVRDVSVTLDQDGGVLYATAPDGRVGVIGRHHSWLEGKDLLRGCDVTMGDHMARTQARVVPGTRFGHYLSDFAAALWEQIPTRIDSRGMRGFYDQHGGAKAREVGFLNITNDLGLFGLDQRRGLRVAYNQGMGGLYAYDHAGDRAQMLSVIDDVVRSAEVIYDVRLHEWLLDGEPKPVSWFYGIGLYLSRGAVICDDTDDFLDWRGGEHRHVVPLPHRMEIDVYEDMCDDPDNQIALLHYVKSTGDFFARVGESGMAALIGNLPPDSFDINDFDLTDHTGSLQGITWYMAQIDLRGRHLRDGQPEEVSTP